MLPGGCRHTTRMHASTYSLGTYSQMSSISGRPPRTGAATGHWMGSAVASMALPSRGRPTLGSVAADLRLGLDRPFGHTHPRYGRRCSTAHTWSLPEKFIVKRVLLTTNHFLFPDSTACLLNAKSYRTQPSPS